MFASSLGPVYTFIIDVFDVLAVLVVIGCAVFLVRRNIIKLKRFISKGLDGWPRSDANYILIMEIILMLPFLTWNSTDRSLQIQGAAHYHDTGSFIVSGTLAKNLSL